MTAYRLHASNRVILAPGESFMFQVSRMRGMKYMCFLSTTFSNALTHPPLPLYFFTSPNDQEQMKCYIRLDSTCLYLQLLLLSHYDTEELKQRYDQVLCKVRKF